MIELKYNPWHDTQDGKFTFSNQGNYASGGGGYGSASGGGTTTSSSRLAVHAKPKKPDHTKPVKIHNEFHKPTKPKAGVVSERTIKPKIEKPKVGKPKAEKEKAVKVAKYFSSETKPTVDNAIAQIKNSQFGKTKAGKNVVDKAERLHKAGKIVIADTTDANGDKNYGKWGYNTGVLTVDTTRAAHVNDIASEIVHETTHGLLSDEYARTNRKPDTNSIDQEALTNGYQLQLYREQRKYRKDKILEGRLKASNKGKLRKEIRSRYPKAPENQPKSS